MAPLRAELEAFWATGPPLALEIGFDHGITLLDNARCFPDWRWLGVELRRARVEALRPLCPQNCLALRLDARTLLSRAPPGRLHRVDILFPTPAVRGRHLLLTPALVDDLQRALVPGGIVQVRTDVPALAALATELLGGWTEAPAPPSGAALSRRERVSRRDGLPIWGVVRRTATT